jgi:hypothetical protein
MNFALPDLEKSKPYYTRLRCQKSIAIRKIAQVIPSHLEKPGVQAGKKYFIGGNPVFIVSAYVSVKQGMNPE